MEKDKAAKKSKDTEEKKEHNTKADVVSRADNLEAW